MSRKTNRKNIAGLAFFYMILSISMLLCQACKHGGGGGASYPTGVWTEKKAELESRFGVPIFLDNVRFPSHWSANNPEYTPVPDEKRYYAMLQLEIDLSKYSHGFLKKFCSGVFIVNSLKFDGQPYGGTNDSTNKWVYLILSTVGDEGHLDAVGFHHEFSSILYKRNKSIFPESAWRSANPSDFNYVFEMSSSRNIASRKTNTRGNSSTYSRGFICEYGELTLEDDINTFSQYLVGKPDKLAKISDEYSKIQRKTEILNQFFKAIGYDG